jgi:transcriptional regulator LmrA/YxaF-like protein
VVEAFLELVRPVVEASAHGGCAVAAVTVGDDARAGAAAAFEGGVEALAGRLGAAGESPREAVDLATVLVSVLEGAHVLCRATAGTEPLERAARMVAALVRRR